MSYTTTNKPPVAIITGAAQGLGKAIAIKLASDGYSLMLADLGSQQAALSTLQVECSSIHTRISGETSLECLFMECDVTVESQVNALVEATVEKLGGLNVMIANAGVTKNNLLLDVTEAEFERIHSVNVKGTFYSYRAAARVMKESGGGRIVGACSVSGKIRDLSKAAVRSLTQTAAQEWGPFGITVNAYAPSAVDTPMWRQDVLGGVEDHPIDAQSIKMTPTGKKTTAEQVAGLVSFLLTPAADNINGQCISINGGMQMD
ncbi:Enoyl-(Acyl carrier protein) reductase [Ceratobasidium sp. AG-Ba]|nr:Enoyl-(Acyl carrier protein) reductase [Ceratobasidium sp. AG-Ba]